jgi:hypothetical protein
MENSTEEQKLYLSDEMYTPISYKGVTYSKPIFRGKGEHTLKELENIIEAYEKYSHQQQIIKQNCKKHLVELKFNIQ